MKLCGCRFFFLVSTCIIDKFMELFSQKQIVYRHFLEEKKYIVKRKIFVELCKEEEFGGGVILVCVLFMVDLDLGATVVCVFCSYSQH